MLFIFNTVFGQINFEDKVNIYDYDSLSVNIIYDDFDNDGDLDIIKHGVANSGNVLLQKIENGELKLPRFQRHQAWDRRRIASLLDTVVQNLPLGVTLLLNVDKEQFISRYLVTAPQTGARVTEHLLDGQQRLTALWRALHNNYESETFFIYLSAYDDTIEEVDECPEDYTVFYKGRWTDKKSD